ncbi:hypothetical protein J3L16_15335 [Alteromonas sp. 5E99-2]|uniref:hypothetical protein n=1 Tax=Alteromonas sp. 5E99-2 TaxID=2817683 RepID=UPI001A9891D3|nr:hypothetical protein [Alteromonas sp. 5E99-2]MBO1257065.1 hypothetical protein [Alteromonas sp. 5E99-2]
MSRIMLQENNYVLPIGLLINSEDKVEIVIATLEISDQIQELVNHVQTGVTEKVNTGCFKASCMAYPDYENSAVVALLENAENYCATVIIPVVTEPQTKLVASDSEVLDGKCYIFPIKQDS